MGSEFNYYIYRGPKDGLGEYHAAYQAEQRVEYGCESYGGHLGTLPDGVFFPDVKPFSNSGEAQEYLADEHQKWSCAMAVPFKGTVLDYDTASRRIIVRRKDLKLEAEAMRKKILAEIQSAKSKTIGCKKCRVSMPRDQLHGLTCPVCGKLNALCSATQLKRLKSKQDKLRDLEARPLKRIDKKGICYVVGGWSAS